MAIKIGFIQLRGAGDCLIAVPIAKFLYDKGMSIEWVIDEKFYTAFKYAVPYVNFHPLSVEEKTIQSNIRNPYWFETPRQMLIDAGCDEVISFPYEETLHFDKIGMPSRLIDPVAIRAKDLRLAFHTTFDQFKYAVCNVPFEEKWNLDIRRDLKREEEFYNKVIKSKKKPYVVTHLTGAMGRIQFNLDTKAFIESIGLKNHEIIDISPLSDNIFDWITIIEKSSCFIGLDSFYVNLIDQMNLKIPKYFIRRSPLNFTPVLRNNWDFLPIKLASDEPHELKF
jgi:hypothetical protein